jgi:SAM-dependent methyltransferase
MGIGPIELRFLQMAGERGALGHTLTIGRQEFLVRDSLSKETGKIVPRRSLGFQGTEDLLRHLGASRIFSLDYSDFEGANVLHDLNEPVPNALRGQYDTVIDLGSAEHVGNPMQAFKNYGELCKVGGQILLSLPANNFCGHGLYQFSPELFFRIYSEKNGFRNLEVFVSEINHPARLFRVLDRHSIGRIEIVTGSATMVLVRVIRSDTELFSGGIFQKDYEDRWNQAGRGGANTAGEASPSRRNHSRILEFFRRGAAAARKRCKRLRRVFASSTQKLEYEVLGRTPREIRLSNKHKDLERVQWPTKLL